MYYSAGSMFLPCADFSIIPELSQMYNHCKSEEDLDMNWVDFITDHLINIDGIFDAHENDDQKPHDASQHHINSPFQLVITKASEKMELPLTTIHSVIFFTTNKMYSFDFVGNVFRPPIA